MMRFKLVTPYICIRTRSLCTVLLRIKDAFSLSEAGYQHIALQHHPPVCVRFAHLDWGYERFSLSEAGSIVRKKINAELALKKQELALRQSLL